MVMSVVFTEYLSNAFTNTLTKSKISKKENHKIKKRAWIWLWVSWASFSSSSKPTP